MTVGEKIEMLCSQLKTQKGKLAEDLGITPQYLSGIIAGRKTPSPTLQHRQGVAYIRRRPLRSVLSPSPPSPFPPSPAPTVPFPL